MGKKLDALLGRSFKTSKFKGTLNLAVSRLAVLKTQRQARCSIARSDVVQILNLGQKERALLRIEQVIREQNMLDVFGMLEGYFHLLIERVHLLEQERECPEELREAASSLVYAATRCGEFPELQEIRAMLTSRFGKEFTARAAELRNNCGVNTKMIQKLSTRMPSLENKMMVLKEIASENNIVLPAGEIDSETAKENLQSAKEQDKSLQSPSEPCDDEAGSRISIFPQDIEKLDGFSNSTEMRRKYKDAADAAQAAFESAAYAAAAARAAVELSRSNSNDPDDPKSPNQRPRKELRALDKVNVGSQNQKHHLENSYFSDTVKKGIALENTMGASKQESHYLESTTNSSSEAANNNLEEIKLSSGLNINVKDAIFDESGDEARNIPRIRLSGERGMKSEVVSSSLENEVPPADAISEERGRKPYYSSLKKPPLGSKAGLKEASEVGNLENHSAEGSKSQGKDHSGVEKSPTSVRTRRMHYW